MATMPAFDEAKLERFMGQFVQDLGACATAPTAMIGEGGFGRVRRAAETPFDIVLEARP
jgi:hypothetical protein